MKKPEAAKKFEYQVTTGQFAAPLNLANPKVQEALADLQRHGGDGWELVGTIGQQMGNTVLFWKREVVATRDEWT